MLLATASVVLLKENCAGRFLLGIFLFNQQHISVESQRTGGYEKISTKMDAIAVGASN